MLKYKNTIDELSTLLKGFNEVDGVLLSGSLASNNIDEFSDIDLYIYLNSQLSVTTRTNFIKKISSYCEVNNQFWETEDCFILEDSGIKVELMYRTIPWISDQLENILVKWRANVGYSTCFCRNFLESKILFDKTNRLGELQKLYSFPYPNELQKNIIDKNLPLLKDIQSSYYNQIKVAVARGDLISLNHRVSAYLESYFDILFAINKIYHPGEKKLLKIILKDCSIIPLCFESDINNLLQLDSSNILDVLNSLTNNLKEIIKTH